LPDSKQVRELGLENYTDKQIWEYAKENHFLIVTFDADFYDFSVIWGHPPKVIWLRTQNQTTKNIEVSLRKYLTAIIEYQQDNNLACLEIIDT